MEDPSSTHPELIEEISLLKQRIKELEQSESERKRVEEALRQEYSFINVIIDNIAEGLCVCHNTTEYPFIKFTIWNDRMAEITGYTVEEINRLGWYQTVYPDPELQAKAIERMKRMRQSENLCAEEWEITRADRNKRILNISTSVVESGDGLVHVLALIQDFTERKRAQEALRESEAKFKEIFETIEDLYYQTDSEGNIKILSPSLYRLTGWNEEDLLGKPASKVYFNPDDRERLLLKLSEKGYVRDYEVLLKKKDGKERQTSLSARLIIDDNGRPIGVSGLLRDITERKQAEEELKQHRGHLEQLIKERTTELIQMNKDLQLEISERKLAGMALKKSKEDLEAKSKTLEELNTALRVLLRQREEDKKSLEDRVVSNVKRLVIPYVEKMKKDRLDPQQRSHLNILETNLNEIVSPFLHTIQQLNLTPRETQIASLIKDGKTTKEIAKIVGVATSSIDSYRNNIRSKLGLNNKKVNLQSCLQSLT
ncbi:MAG: PAS domain S-box protein [Proteobacteria bacterium]|nr:PAS domain S-box protein [Pseudomonadota bacterium]